MNPYLAKDIDHAEQQDREWLKELAIEQRAAEILADPRELDIAVGDQVYGAIPFNPDEFIAARGAVAVAKSLIDVVYSHQMFQKQLERIARKQAEVELFGKRKELPALLRRQAE